MKKALAVCTTALLAIGLAVTGLGTASADEATVPAESVISESVVQEAPAPEAPVDVVSEPVIETPAPVVVEEPVVEAPAEEVISAAPLTAKANSPPVEVTPLSFGVLSHGGDEADVCDPLDSGKINTDDNPASLVVSAPDGQLISGYCIKAGSVHNGNGPLYETLDEPTKTVTLAYPNKGLSHYSLSYVDAPEEPVTYEPTCTTVTGSQVIEGEQYVGDVLTLGPQKSWKVPFSGTLADVGTQLAFTASPSQFTGIWINVDGAWLVFEQGYYNGNVWSKTAFDGIPAGNGYKASAPIADWIALYGNLDATVWVLYGSNSGSTEVSSVTVGCTTYTFKAPEPVIPVVCETIADGGTATNLDPNGWTAGGSGGSVAYVNNGLRMYSPGDWKSATITRDFSGTLADIGSVLDFNAEPSQYVGIHMETSKGWLTFEKEASYGGNVWSEGDFGVASGMGYTTFDTFANVVAANPDLAVTSVKVLFTSPVKASVILTDVTFGCTVYTFDYEKPAKPQTPPVYGDWTTPDITCDNEVGDELAIERTVTTSEYVWENGKWNLHEETTTEPGTYTVTAEDIEALDCPVIITETPVIKFVDECGTENDKAVYEDTEQVTFSEEVVDGQIVVTATANEGFEFAEGVQTVWTSEFTDEECPAPVVPEKPSKTESLPFTGGGDLTPLAIFAWLLTAAGAGLVLRKGRA